MTWTKMLDEARTLNDADVKRHASVSLNNNHQCVECFTCACAVEQQRRASQRARERLEARARLGR
jgi:hypothetical protein